MDIFELAQETCAISDGFLGGVIDGQADGAANAPFGYWVGDDVHLSADGAAHNHESSRTMLTPAFTGFGTAFALIVAIGAQNAFVLRLGLMELHVFWVCLFCAVSDAILIALGVAGANAIGAISPFWLMILTWAGAAFLLAYGALSLRRALRPEALIVAAQGAGSLKASILTCFALTWLNPHVYLETVGLIGAVSTGFSEGQDKLAFALGAVIASIVFFFCLGYGARVLAPIFERPRAWAFLDVGTALVMWAIAIMLIL